MTFIIMIVAAYAVYRFYANQEQAKREAKQKAEAERIKREQARMKEEWKQRVAEAKIETDRLIKRLFGESYQTLVGRRRMEAAELLIRRTDIAFRDIATRVGYESYAGFYLAIKKHFGKTPEELRE